MKNEELMVLCSINQEFKDVKKRRMVRTNKEVIKIVEEWADNFLSTIKMVNDYEPNISVYWDDDGRRRKGISLHIGISIDDYNSLTVGSKNHWLLPKGSTLCVYKIKRKGDWII